METLTTGSLTSNFSDDAVASVVHRAELHAEMVAKCLRSAPSCPEGDIRLPACALLELAAVLQIKAWEEIGLTEHLDANLPSATDAENAFISRCRQGAVAFEGIETATLVNQVLRISIENLAYGGGEYFDTDLAISDIEEDVLINNLAEFLWRHRHVLDAHDRAEE